MADQATIASTEEFRRIAENGRVRGYNQQPSDELLAQLRPDGTHLMTMHLPHEHIAGELVEPHIRGVWMCAVNGSDEPVDHVLMDMSMSDFDSLTVLTKDKSGAWVAPARPTFIEINRAKLYGPYGTNEGDIWLAHGSEVQELIDQERPGFKLVHEMVYRDGVVQEVLYTTSDEEILARAREGHERYMAEQAARN